MTPLFNVREDSKPGWSRRLGEDPNYGIHSDPVLGSSHTHTDPQTSVQFIPTLALVRGGRRGGDTEAPLWLKLATDLLGDHKNMGISSSQQVIFPWARAQDHSEALASDRCLDLH